ncbi:methyl-accepting chemotaxis protein [Deefgea tanakiae]|uniref:Methyl-accepting chemotaxis protein n=1 Tax=Deefgea tanakiae TaxID=2865840 RepID=A0ABX8ZB40_9NEIS|nr:methyl-accepting chemotaxis protein [Deefgea tanakiae]QZA78539.1 methyl-accepting chemotaxis protein [Deefgea tanakiae]
MKIKYKINLAAAAVLLLTTALLSLLQIRLMSDSMRSQQTAAINESTAAVVAQIENWLNAKLLLIDLAAQAIDSAYSPENMQRMIERKVLKDNFILVFGGLETDGKAIKNSNDWNPPETWDARKRPWYPLAVKSQSVALTEPYPDAVSGDILISAVAKISNQGQFLGAFGGDISLKTVSDAVNTLDFNKAGYAFLLSKNGSIISHPDQKMNGKSINELFDGQDVKLEKALFPVQVSGKKMMVSFVPLSNLKGMDWYIGVVLDEAILTKEVDLLIWSSIVGTVVGVGLSVLLLSLLMVKLLRPLEVLSKELHELNSGEGDLTHRLPISGNDEITHLSTEFNNLLQTLQSLISRVKHSSQQVLDSSVITSKTASVTAERIFSQLNELDQLAESMHEMSQQAEHVASSAQSAAHAADQANREAKNGAEVVSRSTLAIKHLADDMNEAKGTIVELARVSQQIESILLVITSIADQTNLLALNAAIEAARAGEAGRGFAVVADEVRKLASMTQHSTSEIREMIDQLHAGVRQAEARMSQSSSAAITTASDAIEANQVLERISVAINKINDMNLQIAAAAEEQSATTAGIDKNTDNIRMISHQVSDGAHAQVAQCELMGQQVNTQEQLLKNFKV